MSDIPWQAAVERVRPYCVRISTPDHSGTGFLFASAAEGQICGLATAAHTLAQAQLWEQPLRLEHSATGTERLIRADDRTIVVDEETDTAALVLVRDGFPLPEALLPTTPESLYHRVGVEIGWVGFPSVAHDHLCFFSGRVSAWHEKKQAYLVDGVAISGVSGGPAFAFDDAGQLQLLGVVSAYLPNKAAGSALPGLSVVQHIGHLEKWVQSLRSTEEAYSRPASG